MRGERERERARKRKRKREIGKEEEPSTIRLIDMVVEKSHLMPSGAPVISFCIGGAREERDEQAMEDVERGCGSAVVALRNTTR